MKLPLSTVRKNAEAKGRPALPPTHSGSPEQAVKQPPEAPARPPAEHPALFLIMVLRFYYLKSTCFKKVLYRVLKKYFSQKSTKKSTTGKKVDNRGES